MKTSVKYNKNQRAWQVTNGTTTFVKGKTAALLVALKTDHRELFEHVKAIYQICDYDKKILGRLLRGAQLLCKGHIKVNEDVRSQHSDEVYQVTFEGIPKTWKCTCEDYKQGRAQAIPYGGTVCKHIFAVMLKRFLNHN